MQLIMMHSPYLDKQAFVTVKQSEEKIQEMAVEFEQVAIYFFVNLDTDVWADEFWVYSNELNDLRAVNPEADEIDIQELARTFPDAIYFTQPKGLIDA